jgi:hypothetical protein
MSRTLAQIYDSIIEEKNTQAVLNGLQPSVDDSQTLLSDVATPSRVADWRLWVWVVAVSIWTFEKVLDVFKVEIETIASKAVPGTASWIQREVFKFQYDATTPQVIELIDFVPAYPLVDEAMQIVTRCSVKTMPNKVVSVKVAKSDPPAALTTPELNALKTYLDVISFAGVQYNTISLSADRLFLAAKIYFNGAYAGAIQATVIAAIENYLATIPFDGIVRVSKLQDAIQSVAGVVDVVIDDMAMRANATAFVSKTDLVTGSDVILNKYPTAAGYIVQEDTVGETFADKLTFIVEA